MFGIDTLLFLFGPFVIPFLVGKKVKSKKRGLIPLLLIPGFFLTLGIILFVSTGTSGHTDATVEDFYAVWLIGIGIYLGFVFITCWLLGRWVRNRKRSGESPTVQAADLQSSQSIDTPRIIETDSGSDVFQASRSFAG